MKAKNVVILIVVVLAAVGVAYYLGTQSAAANAPSQAGTQDQQNTPTAEAAPQDTQASEAEQGSTDASNNTSAQDTQGEQAEDEAANTAPQTENSSQDLAVIAQQFLVYYPANHVLAQDPNAEPVPLDFDSWVASCSAYLDPAGSLGTEMAQSPEDVALRLGWYDAATVVSDTQVSSTDGNDVYVLVTTRGTQYSWDQTVELSGTYRVTFSNSGLIDSVEAQNDLGNSHAH